MIPAFNHSHVLPPFLGDDPTLLAEVSPYQTSALELVQRLGGSPERRALLSGLFSYRKALADLGFQQGFQWIDGSFVEDVETIKQRSPGDIDVVTFAHSPAGVSTAEITVTLNANAQVFDAQLAKAHYGCEGYIVRLDGKPQSLVRRATYYFNLFSHRRDDHAWKGILQLPLESDDLAALDLMHNGDSVEGDQRVAAA